MQGFSRPIVLVVGLDANMDILLRLTVIAIGLFKFVLANGSCTTPVTPYSIVISNGRSILVNNSAILTGTVTSTAKPF